MSKFLIDQLDYIYFIYGLAFILLAAICSVMYRRQEETHLPWVLLGLFGLSHGVNEWLDMLAISLGTLPIFTTIRLIIMIISFIFLLEFGRQGYNGTSSRTLKAWIYLPLLAILIAGYSLGTSGLNAASRYSFCLTGGVLSAIALYKTSRRFHSARYLSITGILMLLYTLSAGVIVPTSAFFPASRLNHDSFLYFTGIPIQLFRALLATGCTYGIWKYHQTSFLKRVDNGTPFQTQIALNYFLIAGPLLFIGWTATNIFGSAMMREVEDSFLLQAKYAAAAINIERIKNIAGVTRVENNPDYNRVREQLITFHHLNPQLHRMRLYTMVDNKPCISVDSAPENSPDHSIPDSLAQAHPLELTNIFTNGISYIISPHTDTHGTFVSALTPVSHPGDLPAHAVLEVEIDASKWKMIGSRYRLVAIITTLLFSSAIVAFAVIRQRMLESAELLRVSRMRFEDSQLQRQRELEELNCLLEEEVEARTAILTETNKQLRHSIDERAKTEELLIEKNHELQQFAYVASHDLQEPLRTITSFIQLLAKRYQGKLDRDADEFIGFITDGAKRMQTLINDLLTYSRVTTKTKPFCLLETKRIVECVLANLRQSISESGVQISVDELPDIIGDETQLLQIFQNLIGNAIKFRSSQDPTIRISGQELTDFWEFSIHDNGIGIEPQFHERIFEVFQRLHNREQYAGTGIGLAVCRKIVERHGGSIRVESTIGRGSTFVFSISKQPQGTLS